MEDFKPTGTPEPPLSKARDWVRYSETAERETNTMPQWAGSCWYYLRFCDARNSECFIGKPADDYWMGKNAKPGGVDLYIGGTEHAVLHLLYARFWHKVLFDLGHLTTPVEASQAMDFSRQALSLHGCEALAIQANAQQESVLRLFQ
jgi:leucyl-tRNA synthetase